MKNKKILLLIISLLCMPTVAFASSSDSIPIIGAIFMEAFVSIHMSVFVLLPLSKLFSKGDSKKLFWRLFLIRLGILLFFDLFISTTIAVIDFLAVFLGAFIVVPICTLIFKKSSNKTNLSNTNSTPNVKGIELKCTKCNGVLKVTDKFCGNCGAPFDGNNVSVTFNSEVANSSNNAVVYAGDFDPIYKLSEEELLEEFIKREMEKCNIDRAIKLIPSAISKKKNILNIIFSVLVFVYISLIFFHFPIYTYALGFIILILFFILSNKYNLIKYLKKQVKSRPGEKISSIVMNAKTTFVKDKTKISLFSGIFIAIALSLLIFINPRIFYEKTQDGYAVRFYTFGITNFKTATIPSTYKGKNVTALRGNAFSNMPLLEEINLPDSIVEIRGQAFKNDKSLVKVKLPSNLTYLGGGAFYNCTSLTYIEIPDSVTYMGGEAFYNATSLKEIKLSNNLSEIRGNTFENCSSLEKITIPDNVTRIGGHAFYGNSSLKSVIFSENSKLNEIGSSAFRRCYNLLSITIPQNVNVNYRAFKESPTKILYFGRGINGKFIYISKEDVAQEIVTKNYGTVYVSLESVEYYSYNKWQFKLNISGGLNETLDFNYYEDEKKVYDDFYIEVSSCNSNGKVGMNIYYN